MHSLKYVVPMTASLLLSACGGGDSNFSLGAGGAAADDTATDPDTEATQALGAGSGSSFQAGVLTIDTTSLSAGGTTGVTVNIVDSTTNALSTTETTVSFNSTCAGQTPAKATIDESITSSAGVATANYQAQGCVGQDTITATLSDGTSASGIVTVASPVIGAIEFTSAEPTTISLAGVGSSTRPENSSVTFKVIDENGNPVDGQTVNFSLSSTLGGTSLSPSSAVSDTSGLAKTTVNAGAVNTTVRVIAELPTLGIETTSDPIAINSGLPDQNSFSLSIETFNPRGWNFDGETSSISILAADQFNNPVPDGTSISFIANAGSIEGSCTTSNGGCSVDWKSQDPRALGGLGPDGIVRILARSTGQESFNDTNSNGVYDLGETIVTPLDEAFSDLNSNSSWDSGEFFSDFNNDNAYTPKVDPTIYQGASCSDDARAAGHCSNLVEVRAEGTLCMSSDFVQITNTPASANLNVTTSVPVTFSDINGLTPAAGTTISITTDNGTIVAGGSPTIPNTCSTSGFNHTVFITADSTPSTGTLTIKATQPDGVERVELVEITD